MKFLKILFVSLFLGTSLFAVVNLNTATKDELMKLHGIGPSKADAIIEYRKTNKFNNIEDIKSVKGIGNATFDKIKGELSVDSNSDTSKDKSDKNESDKNSLKD